MILHSFFRSSAAWRVRIALALKGVDATIIPCNFRHNAQRSRDYLSLNPQGLVPTLVIDGAPLTQSLAIIEYLDETRPEPHLLPLDPLNRARVRAMAQVIASDIHPINNLRVLNLLRQDFGADDETVAVWYRHWIDTGFAALEAMVADSDGRHCFGGAVTIADICLIPQMYNARRYATDLTPYPKLVAIDAYLSATPAFADTAPEGQPDAV
jgi:maleylacetoacetate isomerase